MVAGNFDKIIPKVLISEGGNDDDPHDPGGRTSRGITQKEYNEWRLTHPGLPADVWQAPQQTIIDIYHQNYWNAVRADMLPGGMDYAVFDYGVNSGVGRAIHLMQNCLNVASDGVIGPITLGAAQKASVDEFIDNFDAGRLHFLQGLGTWKYYGGGWTNRVNRVTQDAKALAKESPPTPTPLPPIIEPPKPVPPLDDPVLHDLGSRIMRTMQAKYPNVWFPDQNVVSVEGMDPNGTPNRNRPNAFDDIKMVLDGNGKIIGGPWEGTTQPGVFWTIHPMATGGAFIISLGPQTVWTPGDYHGPAWRQAEDSFIYGTRDPNCTYKRQGQPVKHGNIGVHHHKGYDLPRDNIANAAAGCQVIRLNDEHLEFYNLTTKCPRYLADQHGYRLTATVFEAKEIEP